ncbi:GATA-type zinc finger protein 1 [Solea senegalensis]|uniref:GATA-type zinc finger protein 1 n=1 Tax=Solea senegalensis TaxID=28829 RepID=A0AAV6Q5I9_SOLSE|nr:GATA-type zinc finger protein 1 [Solea senegalensis]XP_043883310.1 GATA-type zinc finger protein 1 [Solea senegalensis]KAG7485252.1 GATA-type zinc finger protein 1 [Solea senegalensis]
MSTAPRTKATFIQGNHQSTVEQETPQSALFYLFQEVSRLASPVHSSFLDTNSSSKWLGETSNQDTFIAKREEEDAHLFQTFNTSCQRSVSGVLPCERVNIMKEESHSSMASPLTEPHLEFNSPWKVLSLINLQCERLMYRSDAAESGPSLVSPTAKSSSAAGGAEEQGVVFGSNAVDNTLRPSLFICKRQEISASVSHVGDMRGDWSRGASHHKPQWFVTECEVGCLVQPQPGEKTTDTVMPELVKEDATASCRPQHRDKREALFSGNTQSTWNQECKKQCISTEFLNIPFSERALSQSHMPSEAMSVDLSKTAPTLDCNANVVVITHSQRDTQSSPRSAVLPSSQSPSCSTERCHPFSQTEKELTQFKPIISTEEKSSPTELKSTSYNVASTNLQPELWPLEKEEIAPQPSQKWRTKTPRKQPHPSRSVDIQDPDIRGVTFRMGPELDDSREHCRLLITSKYSKELFKNARKRRLRTRAFQKTFKTSSSDEESDPTVTVSKGKVCASCCTRKTPMWRDAEDGTPLCNACGIRYKKYRVRCVNCWHIPRKDGNSNSCCLKCGNLVRLTSAQRKTHHIGNKH